MIILLLALCVVSFILGVWVTGISSMSGGFLLVVSAVLAIGTAIVYTLQRIFGKDQRKGL